MKDLVTWIEASDRRNPAISFAVSFAKARERT